MDEPSTSSQRFISSLPAAVVVTYHPDPDVTLRLKRLHNQTAHLVIVDNASNPSALSILRQFSESHPHVELIANSTNLGIAAALNQGIAHLKQKQARWVLTMDQDTLVDEDLIPRLTAILADSPDRGHIGILAANYIDSTGVTLDASHTDHQASHRVRTAITSGSLVNVAAWEQVQGMREDFFIDSVDHDFCFRLRKAGWLIHLTDQPMMTHRMGDPYRVNLLICKPAVSNAPPIRRYYMTRNRVAMLKAHGLYEPRWIIQEIIRAAADLLLITLHESDKLPKLKAMLRGAWHGLIGRMNASQ